MCSPNCFFLKTYLVLRGKLLSTRFLLFLPRLLLFTKQFLTKLLHLCFQTIVFPQKVLLLAQRSLLFTQLSALAKFVLTKTIFVCDGIACLWQTGCYQVFLSAQCLFWPNRFLTVLFVTNCFGSKQGVNSFPAPGGSGEWSLSSKWWRREKNADSCSD